MFGEQNPEVSSPKVHPLLSVTCRPATARFFFNQPEVKEKYSSLDFVLEVQSLKMTVLSYRVCAVFGDVFVKVTSNLDKTSLKMSSSV